MGKGSARRNEDINKIWDNWDKTFGKKDKSSEKTEDTVKTEEKEPEKDESTKTK